MDQRVANLEAWRNQWDGSLPQFPGFQKDTSNSFGELFVSKQEHENLATNVHDLKGDYAIRVSGLEDWKTGEFEEWKTGVDNLGAGFETWKNDAEKKFEKLDGSFKDKLNMSDYKADKESLDGWRNAVHKKFESFDNLMSHTVKTKDYQADKKKFDDEIAILTHNTNTLKDGLSTNITQLHGRIDGLEDKTRPLFGRLNTLENKTNELEKRVSGHDDEIKGFDAEFTKLGDRITKQGTKMDEGFITILEEIRTGSGWNRPGITTKAAAGIATAIATAIVATEGEKGGGDRETGGGGRKSVKGGDRSLTKYQSNYESPGGINVANYGQLSVQHAPSCTRFSNSSRNDNSNNHYIDYCPCQSLSAPQEIYGCYGGGSGRWGGLEPYTGPHIRTWDSNEGRYERQRRGTSDLQEGGSNFNVTPNITLGLSRQSGGGLFSRGKSEDLFLELGKGVGGGESGRRKHKSKDSAWHRG